MLNLGISYPKEDTYTEFDFQSDLLFAEREIDDQIITIDRAMVALEHICDELCIGISAIDNAYAVEQYVAVHGITNDFKELIGDEALVKSAAEGIKSAVQWLLRKIKELVQWVVSAFAGIPVLIKDAVASLRSITVPYDLEKVAREIKNAYGTSDKAREELKQLFEEDKTQHTYMRPKFISLVNMISSESVDKAHGAMVSAKSISEQCEKIATEFEKKEQEGTLSEKDFHAANDKLRIAGGYMLAPDDLRVTKNFRSDLPRIMQKYAAAVKEIMPVYKECLAFIRGLLKHLHRREGTPDIEISVPFSPEFKEHLFAYYGKKIKLKEVVVSNKKAAFNIREGKRVDGYAMTGNLQHEDTVYISYDAVRSTLHRLMSASGFSQQEVLIRLIVHEAKHLFDGQTGEKFVGYDTWKGYWFADEERRARKAARRFKIDAADKSFANKILAELSKAEAEDAKETK